SYVLGGRAMEIVHTLDELSHYMRRALAAREGDDNPILIDRFLSDAIEVDVDAVSDGQETVIGAVMEHIEEAGIHSGDSACAPPHVAVKEAVFPFTKFPGTDTLLGPEMRSTGEVMGIDRDFPLAFAKAQLGAGMRLPSGGTVFISVKDTDKPAALDVARRLHG